MTRPETGKKIQVLDSITTFAQQPELSIWKTFRFGYLPPMEVLKLILVLMKR